MRTAVAIDHVFLTRFNLPSRGPESLIRAQDGWLQNRVELFERFTVPSIRAQSAAGSFSWLVFFDRESPEWLIQRMQPLIAANVFTPVFGEEFEYDEIVAHAREVSGGHGELLLTTNLDNDDAIAVDFAERVQALAVPGESRALYLGTGLILSGSYAYLRHDPENAFVSVAEPWANARSVWREWHNLLHKHMPVHTEAGRPGWLQVVHGRNVSNRVRGRLADPTRYRREFPGFLDQLPAPAPSTLLRDHYVRVPLRECREVARRTGKAVLLRTVGKSGLDRIKETLQTGR